MRRHSLDVLSLLLGCASIGVALAVLTNRVSVDWYRFEHAAPWIAGGTIVLIVVAVVQGIAGRRRQARVDRHQGHGSQ